MQPNPYRNDAVLSAGLWCRSGSESPGGEIVTSSHPSDGSADVLGEPPAADRIPEALLRRLDALLRLPADWDSYGAPPIEPRAVRLALAFLLSVPEPGSLAVVPTSQGGIQLERHAGGVHVELECLPSGRALLFVEDDDTSESVERYVVPGHPAVEAWFERAERVG